MTPADRTAWVIGLDVDSYAKAVLHVLAFRANNTTLKCWITVNRLTREAGMSRRKVQATLRELESVGLLIADRSVGRKSNTYTLNMKANSARRAPLNRAQRAPLSAPNRAQGVIQPCTTRHSTVHSVHPEQVLEPGIEQPSPSAPSVWNIGEQWISRALLAKCIRDHGEETVSQAIAATDLKKPADPKSYLLGVLKSKKPPEVHRVANDW